MIFTFPFALFVSLDFPIQSEPYLSNTSLFIFCNIMNYPILPSYQPEQPSYLPYQAKPMTMDYMPEYSAPVSSISSTPEVPVQPIPVAPVSSINSTPEVPVQPIPVAPVSTLIPMSPESNYVPQDLRTIFSERS